MRDALIKMNDHDLNAFLRSQITSRESVMAAPPNTRKLLLRHQRSPTL